MGPSRAYLGSVPQSGISAGAIISFFPQSKFLPPDPPAWATGLCRLTRSETAESSHITLAAFPYYKSKFFSELLETETQQVKEDAFFLLVHILATIYSYTSRDDLTDAGPVWCG